MESIDKKNSDFEISLKKLDARIENLKAQYNLFFSGELSIPPEKERENMEKEIRNILSKDLKSSKLSFLTQNVSSKFTLYNNMWLKRLNQIELGLVQRKRKTPSYDNNIKKTPTREKSLNISLNDEKTFDNFFDNYDSILKQNKLKTKKSKDDMINSLKYKLISENLIDANVKLSFSKGKIKIKIK
ncbi:MAG: hypothetical protein ABFR75_00695 [Acidobacteriota bacterium]